MKALALQVYFELAGAEGRTGQVAISAPPACFAPGRIASFVFPSLPYCGELHTLRIGADGSGLFPAWHLRCVEVIHTATDRMWLFACHAWLDQKCRYQRILFPAFAVGLPSPLANRSKDGQDAGPSTGLSSDPRESAMGFYDGDQGIGMRNLPLDSRWTDQ